MTEIGQGNSQEVVDTSGLRRQREAITSHNDH